MESQQSQTQQWRATMTYPTFQTKTWDPEWSFLNRAPWGRENLEHLACPTLSSAWPIPSWLCPLPGAQGNSPAQMPDRKINWALLGLLSLLPVNNSRKAGFMRPVLAPDGNRGGGGSVPRKVSPSPREQAAAGIPGPKPPSCCLSRGRTFP